MNDYDRKAAFLEARAEAYEVSLARHSVAPSKHTVVSKTPTTAEIEALVDRKVAVALSEIRLLSDARQAAVGKALGEVRAKLREEIVAAVGELRADVYVAKAHAGDTVIDLPALPLRRHGSF